MTETIITNNTIIHNHNMDKSIQQLRDIKNILHSNTTSINQMIHSVSEIATKLGFEISLPSLIPLSPAPPTPLFAAAATSTTGDSDLDNEKSQPTDNSETISQPSNPDLIEMLDLKAATTLVDSEAAQVYAGVIARLQPQFNLKLWSSHVETLDESWEKERKSALGDARNLFDKIIRKTELSLQLNKYEISSSTVSMFYPNDPLDCTLIVGVNNVFIFDPGGHDLKYNKAGLSQLNIVLADFSQGMNQVEDTVEIHLVAIKPLNEALSFSQTNFEYQIWKDHMMSVLCKAVVSKETEIRQSSLECFVAISSIYYVYLQPYMEEFSMLTANVVNNEEESIVLQALEFWSSICNKEIEVLVEYGDSGNLISHFIIRKAVNMLVPMVLDPSLKQDEVQDQYNANWKLSTAGRTCLRLVAKTIGHEIVPLVMPFVEGNIPNAKWRSYEATTLAFGSILKGPSVKTLSPLVHAKLGFLLNAMNDHSCHVKNTTTWTLGRMYEILHYSYSSHPVVLTENLPRIISVLSVSIMTLLMWLEKVCGAMYFFVLGYEESESKCVLLSTIASLLSRFEHTDNVSATLCASTYKTLDETTKLSIEIMTRQGKTIELQIKMACDKEKHSELSILLYGVPVKNFIEYIEAINKNKTFVFDLGGNFDVYNIFDLEDKVVFEGMAMIRISLWIVPLPAKDATWDATLARANGILHVPAIYRDYIRCQQNTKNCMHWLSKYKDYVHTFITVKSRSNNTKVVIAFSFNSIFFILQNYMALHGLWFSLDQLSKLLQNLL